MTVLVLAPPRCPDLVAEADALAGALAAGGLDAQRADVPAPGVPAVAITASPWGAVRGLAIAGPLVLRVHGLVPAFASGARAGRAAHDGLVDLGRRAARVVATSPGLARALRAAGAGAAEVVPPVLAELPPGTPGAVPADVVAVGPLARLARLDDAVRAAAAWHAAGCPARLVLAVGRREEPGLARSLRDLAAALGGPRPLVVDATDPAALGAALDRAALVLQLGEEPGVDPAALQALRRRVPIVARGAGEELPGALPARTDDPVVLGLYVRRLLGARPVPAPGAAAAFAPDVALAALADAVRGALA